MRSNKPLRISPRDFQKAVRLAYRKGQRAAEAEFDTILERFKALKELNGHGDLFAETYYKRRGEPTEPAPQPQTASGSGKPPEQVAQEVWQLAPDPSHVESFRFLEEPTPAIEVTFKKGGEYRYDFPENQRDTARVVWEEMAAANHPGIVIWEWLIRGGVPYKRLKAFLKAFDESKHPRNHGQFASSPGNSAVSQETESAPAASDNHARTLAARIGSVPAAIREKVTSFVRDKYGSLVSKFGTRGAKAILAASVLMLPVPAPFASFYPIAIANALLKLKHLILGESAPALAKAMGGELSDEEIQREARALIESIYADAGEEPPGPADDDTDEHTPLDGGDEEADTPTVVPGDSATHPDGDAVALALLEHAIPAMELGEDPEPGLRAILGAMDGGKTVEKSFDESKHPRDDAGRFVSKEAIHEAKSDPTKAAELRARVTDPAQRAKLDAALEGKTDLGRTKQGERKQLAAQKRYISEADKKRADELIRHFADNYSTGELTRADLKRLVEHLPRMRLVDLKRAREALRANLHGDRQKRDVVARLVAHAKDQIAELTPDRKKRNNRLNTVIAEVMAHGGIDPKSHALLAHIGDVKYAGENNLPLSIFRRGGQGLDQMAQELASAGHISIPENAHPGEYLLDQIRSRAHTLAADLGKQEEDKLNEYYKALHEAELHHGQPALEEAIRSGEGAGRDQASEDLLGETGGESDTQEPEGAVDDSFDFGANVGGEPSEPAPQHIPSTSHSTAPGPDPRAVADAREHLDRMTRWQADRPGSRHAEAARDRAERQLAELHSQEPDDYNAPAAEPVGHELNIGSREEYESGLKRTPAASSEPKEPHEMTREEYAYDTQRRYATKFGRPMPANVVDDVGLSAHTTHRALVESALKRGEPVPANVLADYPDLAAKHAERHKPEPLVMPSAAQETKPADTGRNEKMAQRAKQLEPSLDKMTHLTADEKEAYRQQLRAAPDRMTQNRILESAGEGLPAPKPGTATADPVSEPTTPVAHAVEQAQAKDESPRQVAAAATKAQDSEYEFARESAISNAGEDLKGSARHKVNAWRGLADAEKNGTAEKLVTRDNLLKAEPHSLMATIQPDNAMSHLAAHLALNAFPGQVGNPDKVKQYLASRERDPSRKTAEELRAQYYEAFKAIKEEAQKAAIEETDPTEVSSRISDLTQKLISKYRGIPENATGYERSSGYSAKDIYNPVANALVALHKATASYYRTGKNSVPSRLKDFASRVKNAYPEQGGDTSNKIAEHVQDVIEGDSFNKTFGTTKEGNKGFSPADLYVKHATRKGGRVINAATVKAGTDFIMKNAAMRGLQWGNSVSDDERQHHLSKTVEALADLADVTGLPDSAMGLKGTLGLAVGARGHGTALAHYEPDTKVINLTRKNGVGSLAHEWGHALDHLLSGEGPGSMRSLFEDAHHKLYMSKREGSPESQAKDVPVWEAMNELRKTMQSSGFDSRLSEVVGKMRRTGELSDHKARYWSSGLEKFARAFETHVRHKLESEGRENTYLSGVESHALWPSAEETKHMAPAFDKLFDAVREHHFKS